MKQFFKMMFASAIGVLISMGILSFISVFMFIGMLSSMSSSSTEQVLKNDESVFKLSLNGEMKETANENPFGSLFGKDNTLCLSDILTAIEAAKENDKIKGIYLDLTNLATGTANVDVIRRELLDFKKNGKFIVAYADNYTQKCYHLASVADKVYLNPLGMVQLTGLVSQAMFYKEMLKKVGVEVLVFKVGTFKGAVEPFMLDKLSEANRMQITSYQKGIWDNIVENISESRNISVDDVNAFADEGLFFSPAEKAVESGLIDDLKYRDDVENTIKELAGIDADKKLKTVNVAKMKNQKKKNTIKKGEQIARLCRR
jgi:Periplasmic serine proteases (ClpP class)